jgi:tetratricopeptide (TPR) repeat protein
VRTHILSFIVSILILGSAQVLAQSTAQQRYYDEIAAREDYIKGLAAYEMGELDKAIELLSKAYVRIPKEAALSFALAEAYMKKADLTKATMYAKEAVQREPKNKWYRLKLAEIYGETGQYESTIRVLKELIDLNPKDLNALGALAAAQTRQKKYQDANQTLNKILKVGGESWSVYYDKFQNFEAMQLRDSSVVILRKMQELEPENLVTLQILSQIYSETNDTSRAKTTLINALRVNRRDPETLLMLADLYIEEAKWDSAGTLIASFVGDTLINPYDKLPFVDHMLNVYRADAGNEALSAAVTSVVKAYTKAHPSYGPAFAYAGQLFIELDRKEDALAALERTTELMPTNEFAWQEWIRILLQTGEYEKAIQIGLIADEQVPDNPFVLYLVGNAFLMKDDAEAALSWLERASTLPARNDFKSAVFTSIGDVYVSKKNLPKADANFERALQLQPENDVALNNYAYSLSNRNDASLYPKALEMALSALKIAPDNASYLDTTGWIYFRMAEYRKAQELVKKSLEINPESAEVQEHMGEILAKLGERKKAIEYWKKALELDPTRTHLSKNLE